jgi:antitoxin MazE
MKSAIRKMGNSHGVIIPKLLLEEVGAAPNDPVDLKVKKGRIVITPARPGPRAGWAEASKALTAAGEGRLVWPQHGHAGNDKLVW